MRASQDKAAFQAALDTYCQMMADGKGSAAALESTGLSHAQAGLAWYESPKNPDHVVRGAVAWGELPGKAEPGYEVALRKRGHVVAELRNGTHAASVARGGERFSWGQIMILVNANEGNVRRAFQAATSLDSRGQRTGQGGRFLDGNAAGYVGNHKAHGIQDAKPRTVVNATYVKQADKWNPVLPTTVEALRAELGGATRQRAPRAKKATKATK